MALSIGFGNSVALLPAIQATRLLTFASVGLSPTEHTCFSWSRFRKAGFPRYGFKAGRSGGAFPAMPKLRVDRFASALRALRFRVSAPLCVGGRPALEHLRSSGFCRSTPGALAPVRVILSRYIYAYPAPSAPLVGTSRFHRTAAYTRRPRCASPPRRPTTGSLLSLASSIDMSPSGTPESSSAASTQFFADDTGLRPVRKVSALPLTPPSDSRGGHYFGASLRFAFAATCRFARPSVGADRVLSQPTGTFTSGLSTAWSPSPSPDMTTAATGQVPLAGFAPARMPTSIAAIEPECLENLQTTAREIPRDGAEAIPDTQAVCGFRYWASKHTLFHTINTMVAIFLAK